MAVLKGGVIGFGNMGQGLTRYINQHKKDQAQIVAACNPDGANLTVARDDFGLSVTHNAGKLVNMDLDFVLVTSPSHVHAEQVVLAAKAGKHVFAEKPIALNLADADRMIQAVESAGVINAVNYSLRYTDAYLKIKDLVDSGRLGDILSITYIKLRGFGLYGAGARHVAVVNAEESGGWAVHDACHNTDLLYWLNGPIKTVYATTQTTVPAKNSEEVVLGNFTFANGAIGQTGDSVCNIRGRYTQIIGSKASLLMTGEHEATELRFQPEGASSAEIIPAVDSKPPGIGIDHFLECIRNNHPSPNSIRDSRHSLAVALAMQESARTGQVISVD